MNTGMKMTVYAARFYYALAAFALAVTVSMIVLP